MRRQTIWKTVLGAMFLLASGAHANPMSLDVARGQQVPKTTHVQLTYAVDGQDPATPSAVTRDSKPIALTWQTGPANYAANNGSGIASLRAIQTCDCNAPLGSHDYVLRVKRPHANEESDFPLTVGVVQGYAPVPLDAGPARDMSPWEIPNPTEIQGIDCAKICAGLPPADAGVGNDGSTKDAASGKDAGTIPPAGKDSGCALAGQPTGATLLLLCLALLFARRRG